MATEGLLADKEGLAEALLRVTAPLSAFAVKRGLSSCAAATSLSTNCRFKFATYKNCQKGNELSHLIQII